MLEHTVLSFISSRQRQCNLKIEEVNSDVLYPVQVWICACYSKTGWHFFPTVNTKILDKRKLHLHAFCQWNKVPETQVGNIQNLFALRQHTEVITSILQTYVTSILQTLLLSVWEYGNGLWPGQSI